MTPDRIVHGIVALVCVALFLRVRRPHRLVSDVLTITAMALLGSWVPDWDLLLDIGFHRSPVTHSALPAVAFVLATRNRRWVYAGTGLSLGIASHLLWDIVDYGNVVGIPGGNADRMFLLTNAAFLVIAATWMTRPQQVATKNKESAEEAVASVPPEIAEEAMRSAVRETIAEEEGKLTNRKTMDIDRFS